MLTLLALREGLWNASMSCSGKPVEGVEALEDLGILSEGRWKHASRAQPTLCCREAAWLPKVASFCIHFGEEIPSLPCAHWLVEYLMVSGPSC